MLKSSRHSDLLLTKTDHQSELTGRCFTRLWNLDLHQTITLDGNILWLCAEHRLPYEVQPLALDL